MITVVKVYLPRNIQHSMCTLFKLTGAAGGSNTLSTKLTVWMINDENVDESLFLPITTTLIKKNNKKTNKQQQQACFVHVLSMPVSCATPGKHIIVLPNIHIYYTHTCNVLNTP